MIHRLTKINVACDSNQADELIELTYRLGVDCTYYTDTTNRVFVDKNTYELGVQRKIIWYLTAIDYDGRTTLAWLLDVIQDAGDLTPGNIDKEDEWFYPILTMTFQEYFDYEQPTRPVESVTCFSTFFLLIRSIDRNKEYFLEHFAGDTILYVLRLVPRNLGRYLNKTLIDDGR